MPGPGCKRGEAILASANLILSVVKVRRGRIIAVAIAAALEPVTEDRYGAGRDCFSLFEWPAIGSVSRPNE
jgi:hypothetical protein